MLRLLFCTAHLKTILQTNPLKNLHTMITTLSLQEEIQKQVEIGFSRKEIEENLRPKGFNDGDIKQALDRVQFAPEAVAGSSGGSVSTKSILIGILFLIAACFRFARAARGGSFSFIFGIGVITAISMAIYFFTKKK